MNTTTDSNGAYSFSIPNIANAGLTFTVTVSRNAVGGLNSASSFNPSTFIASVTLTSASQSSTTVNAAVSIAASTTSTFFDNFTCTPTYGWFSTNYYDSWDVLAAPLNDWATYATGGGITPRLTNITGSTPNFVINKNSYWASSTTKIQLRFSSLRGNTGRMNELQAVLSYSNTSSYYVCSVTENTLSGCPATTGASNSGLHLLEVTPGSTCPTVLAFTGCPGNKCFTSTTSNNVLSFVRAGNTLACALTGQTNITVSFTDSTPQPSTNTRMGFGYTDATGLDSMVNATLLGGSTIITSVRMTDFGISTASNVNICDKPLQTLLAVEQPSQTIYGIVYRDYNANAVRDRYEFGIQGATVNVFTDLEFVTPIASVSTNELGEFWFTTSTLNVPNGTPLRLEVPTPEGYFFPSFSNNRHVVMPSSYVDFGFFNPPEDYCFINTTVVSALYIGGTQNTGASTLLSYRYTGYGTNIYTDPSMANLTQIALPPANPLVTDRVLGTTWGLTWQQVKKKG